VLAVDFDPPDQRSDDLPCTVPIEPVETVAHSGREVLDAADDEGELAFGVDRFGGRTLLVSELGDARLERGDARLELGAIDHARGIAVDQPTDPAPKSRQLALGSSQLL
jgi:hypothetical protein